MGIKRWLQKRRDPEYAEMLEWLEHLADNPQEFESLVEHSRTILVKTPPEWDQENSRWTIHAYGLVVTERLLLTEGRGGKPLEMATVTEALGNGRWVITFDSEEPDAKEE